MKALMAAALSVLVPAGLLAQDAVKTLPDNYKVAFENDHVRVTRVHYGPHATLPGHTHTSLASAYVYLNDSGPVAFTHVGGAYGAVRGSRPRRGSSSRTPNCAFRDWPRRRGSPSSSPEGIVRACSCRSRWGRPAK